MPKMNIQMSIEAHEASAKIEIENEKGEMEHYEFLERPDGQTEVVSTVSTIMKVKQMEKIFDAAINIVSICKADKKMAEKKP